MNFDIQLSENHNYNSGDIYTNNQGVSFLISFLYPPEVIESETEPLTTIYRACCTLPRSTDCAVKLGFDQTSDEFLAVSMNNGALEITTDGNRSSYCGLIFPAVRDESNNITSLTGSLHRAFLLPLR